MQIPNDLGGNWRRNKLVQYIGEFPDEIGPLIRRFFREHKYDKDQQVWWVLLYSACYCMGSACILSESLNFQIITKKQLEKFWAENKQKLIFQSDRRYIKNMDQFTIIAWEFIEHSHRHPWQYMEQFFKDTPEETYKALYREVSSWKYYGRFGTILFLYNLNKLLRVPLDSQEYDWKSGSTTTAALFNADYQDDRADEFEKTPKLTAEEQIWLDAQLHKIISVLKKRYPERNWTVMGVTSDMCSYRKLYKQSRYLGFYVDRQQDELRILEALNPEFSGLVKNFWGWRKKYLPEQYLGELQGWDGVQKWRNKSWVTKGVFR